MRNAMGSISQQPPSSPFIFLCQAYLLRGLRFLLFNSVMSVAFSPESARLASASDDGTVKIWNAGSDKCPQTLEGHPLWGCF
jgi:WD40 repeat protein